MPNTANNNVMTAEETALYTALLVRGYSVSEAIKIISTAKK